MDAGSALVAGLAATIAFTLAVTALRRAGRTDLDLVDRFGRRLAAEPAGVVGAGVVSLVTVGALDALALAAVWGVTGWPIAPLQGTLMALAQWPVARGLAGSARGAALGLLVGLAAYGATLGLVYSPGI